MLTVASIDTMLYVYTCDWTDV